MKSRPENIEAVKDGRPFDVRKDDRFYQVGDWLHLREYRKLPDGKYGDLHVFAPVCAIQPLMNAPFVVDEMIEAADLLITDLLQKEDVPELVMDVLGDYVILGLDLRAMQFVRSDAGARVVESRIKSGEIRWAR